MSAMTQPDPDLPALPEGSHPAVRGVALLARIMLQFALFAAAGWFGFVAADGHWWRWAAMIAAPVLLAAAWASWVSLRAPNRPAEPVRVVIEALLFGGAGATLWAWGHPWLGVALAGAWLVDQVVLAVVRPFR